jgi:hypothetical protein
LVFAWGIERAASFVGFVWRLGKRSLADHEILQIFKKSGSFLYPLYIRIGFALIVSFQCFVRDV